MNKAKSIEMFLIQFKEVGILSVLGYIQKFEFDKFKLNHISLLFKNLPNDVEENLFLNFEKINLKVFFFFFNNNNNIFIKIIKIIKLIFKIILKIMKIIKILKIQ
jgi:hypothetical protein